MVASNTVTDGTQGDGGVSNVFMSRVKLNEVSNGLRAFEYSARDLRDLKITTAMTGTQIKEAFVEIFPSATDVREPRRWPLASV